MLNVSASVTGRVNSAVIAQLPYCERGNACGVAGAISKAVVLSSPGNVRTSAVYNRPPMPFLTSTVVALLGLHKV